MDRCKGRKNCSRETSVKYIDQWMCDFCLKRFFDKQEEEWQKKQEKKVKTER